MNWSPITELLGFAPSADPTTPSVFTDASNLIPSDRGWRCAYSLADTGVETLTATCVGAALVQLQSGDYVTVAGTGGRLFVRAGAAWTDVSESATAYTASTDQRWRFASMGDFILAATTSDTVQVSAGGATFGAITGAPKAALIESVFGFVMAAATNDATYGNQPDRWWCSAIFDHTDWTPALETQATTGRLVDTPGPIRAIRRLGSNIVAYKDSSMYLGEYVEPPTVWDWRLISSDVGAPSHDGVVNLGRAHLFMSNRNFYLFDGAQLQAVGDPVREWYFTRRLLRAYADRVQSVHDVGNGLVYWFYPSVDGAGELNEALVYNYRSDRWGVATYGVQVGLDFVASVVTYDTLGDYYTTFDAGINRTYDSPLWIPDTVSPAVFDSAAILKTLDGASSGGSFTTSHLGDDQRFSLLRRVRVRWLTPPSGAVLNLATVDEHGNALTPRASNIPLAGNRFDLLASARWHRLNVVMTGDAEFRGLQVDIAPQGDW